MTGSRECHMSEVRQRRRNIEGYPLKVKYKRK